MNRHNRTGTPGGPAADGPEARRRPPHAATVLALGLALVSAGCATDSTSDAGSRTNAASGTSNAGTTTEPATSPPTSTSAAPGSTSALPEPPTTSAASPRTWQLVSAEGPAPSPRSSAVLAAQPDGTLWLHGGLGSDGASNAELWRFDGVRWEQRRPAGPVPAARNEHVAVWDEARQRLVIALGQDTKGDVFDDVWAYDPAANAWAQLAATGPAARYGSCAVLDGTGRMLITHGFSSRVRFDDTWAFDLASDTWTDVTPAIGPRPFARCLHACTFDPESQELVMFGGRRDDDPFLGDTWRLGPGGWTEVTGPGPTPRVRSRGIYDGGMQVIGGIGADGLPGDAWRLTVEGWQVTPSGPVANRESAAVAQGPTGAWLFGGRTPGGELDDLWRLA